LPPLVDGLQARLGLGRIGLRLEPEGRISKGSGRGPAYPVQNSSGTPFETVSYCAFGGPDMPAPHDVKGAERSELALTRLIGEPECPPRLDFIASVFRAAWFRSLGTRTRRGSANRIQASDGSSPVIPLHHPKGSRRNNFTFWRDHRDPFSSVCLSHSGVLRIVPLRAAARRGQQQNVNLFLREP
jgi:hypothetical protein